MYNLEVNMQFVWEKQLFDHSSLRTECGQSIEILFPGYPNTDSGPDFSEAKIRIGNLLFVGNVELHLRTSDWLKHGHQNDPVYQHVILHVVLETDICSSTLDTKHIPHLSIGDYLLLDEFKVERIRQQEDRYGFHCRGLLGFQEGARQKLFEGWRWSLLEERFVLKRDVLLNDLIRQKGDIRAWAYQVFAEVYGKPINGQAMEILSRILPLGKVAKLQRSLLDFQAVFFGISGLLERASEDTYFNELSARWSLLAYKFTSDKLSIEDWKYFRLRPYGFPDRRIAQFAAFCFNRQLSIDELLSFKDKQDVYTYFGFSMGLDWEGRCRVDKKGTNLPLTAHMSVEFIDRLIINAIIPMMMVLSKHHGQPLLKVRAFDLLATLRPERNKHQRAILSLGIKTHSAVDTQAALMLRENYCKEYRCLKCRFWQELGNN